MYNSIYPVNINYRKHSPYNKTTQNEENTSSSSNAQITENSNEQNTFPNGTKVAIDYSKGQINISQVLMDFRSTILAINAPREVQEEVYLYLNLVEKESHKEVPSKDIIVANLKNASRISDAFIASSLKKPSNVVEGWIDALFLQKINLKADPNEVNPDFLLEFPKNAQEKIDKAKSENFSATSTNIEAEEPNKEIEVLTLQDNNSIHNIKEKTNNEPVIEIDNSFDISSEEIDDESDIETDNSLDISRENVVFSDTKEETNLKTPFTPLNDTDKVARDLFIQAKNAPETNAGDTEAVNLLNEALGILQSDKNANENIRAAIHFERGRIFDDYNYVNHALRDYFEASKAQELNLKSQAFYRCASIYDEFGEFSPALDNYLSAVAYSGEADNPKIQSRALSSIASLYAKQYDEENTDNYSALAIDAAYNSNDNEVIASTYSNSAQNYQQLGDDDKAIDYYKNALLNFSHDDESFEQMAYNYEQASLVMDRLGNHAKAEKLLLKANLYYQKAQLQEA